ncbi:MAG: DNA polymerase III subunit gamma/tau [Clostridia bacterium]|nr:DNA polymerase III subunit gamma/tau [Clostridia bacterium]
MYQVLYRKWRPQTFSDVYGQPVVTTALKNELRSNRLAHAYLFTGSRGTGKTSCAKILAKAVNCLHPVDGDPCNECDNCRGIDAGTILDVTEIDAASNNGVDNIRDLRDEVNFAPAVGKYRVYIIDEVHMLSAGAFNALLKTLEEPPEHVIFILATTEVHKLPATILSRCQRFDFGRIPPADIAARLQFVAQHEQITLSDDAALMIARLADGGMRDALSLLDQCLSRSREVTAAVVAEATGMAGRGHLFSLSAAIRSGNGAAALELLNDLHNSSKDMERLCAELIDFYRNLMILKSVGKPGDLIVLSPAELEEMRAEAAGVSLEAVLHILDVLQHTLDRLKSGVSRRVEMETTLLRLCDPRLDTTSISLLRRVEALEAGVSVPKTAPTPVPAPATTPATDDVPEPPAPVEEAPPVPAPTAASAAEPVSCDHWPEVLAQISQKSPPLYGVLVDSTAMTDGEKLIIMTDNEMFGALVRADGNKAVLMNAVQAVLGKPMRIIRGRPQPTATVDEASDPLSAFLRQSAQAGISIDMKG